MWSNCRQFDAFVECNKGTKQEKATALILALGGKVQEFQLLLHQAKRLRFNINRI